MYKVIGFPQTRALRVIWLLEELGEPYEIDPALPQSSAIKSVNLTGKIPALMVGDAILIESVAICTYLADQHGKCTFPAGTLERARQDSFTQFAVDVLEGALWTAAKNSFVLPEDVRVPAIKEVCKREFSEGLSILEQRLGDGPYVMGGTFTIADIVLGHCLGWAIVAKFGLPESGKVFEYFERLKNRSAYKAMRSQIAKAK